MAGRDYLLLTATIEPPVDARLLARTDPALRRRDYVEALRFYLDTVGSVFAGLAFVDNSGADVSDIVELVRPRADCGAVEVRSYQGLGYPATFGRAFGEVSLIEWSMRNVGIFRELGDADFVWKVTGRYRVDNIAALVRSRPSRCDLYCNLRTRPTRWADMYVLGFDRRGYDRVIAGCGETLRHDVLTDELPGLSPENALFRIVRAAASDIAVVPRFRVPPKLRGTRGSDNRPYFAGSERWKYYARVVASRIAPGLWI